MQQTEPLAFNKPKFEEQDRSFQKFLDPSLQTIYCTVIKVQITGVRVVSWMKIYGFYALNNQIIEKN